MTNPSPPKKKKSQKHTTDIADLQQVDTAQQVYLVWPIRF